MIFSEEILHTDWFAALAAFVAINTTIYAVLAIAKTLPKIYVTDYLPRNYERAETRSIYPDVEEPKRKKSEKKD